MTRSEFGAGELEDVALHGLVAVVDDDQRGGLKTQRSTASSQSPMMIQEANLRYHFSMASLIPCWAPGPPLHGLHRGPAAAVRRHQPRRRHGRAQAQWLPLEELARHEPAFIKPMISDRKHAFSTTNHSFFSKKMSSRAKATEATEAER